MFDVVLLVDNAETVGGYFLLLSFLMLMYCIASNKRPSSNRAETGRKHIGKQFSKEY